MNSQKTEQQEFQPQSEAEPAFWTQRRKFPEPMEVAFQLEMDGARETRNTKTGMVAILLFSAFAISDLTVVPDAYQKAWAIRFLLVVPLMLLCVFGVYRLKSLAMREATLGAMVVVSGVSLPWIAALSNHPNAVHYQTGVTLVILFGNIVMSQRFRTAMVTTAILLVVYAVALANSRHMPIEIGFNNWLFCFSAGVISLIANFRMDQDQRRAYVARQREQERNQELSHAVELLARLSSEDGLTHIANRREFDHRLDIEWGRARRDGQPLSLIMIDIDFFKNYNDHYGHPAGDACLQQVAGALSAIPKRSVDLVARFGGEEFVVLLPATSLEEAARLAERMRQALIDLQIPHATSRIAPGVTASLGVASLRPAPQQQAGELIAAADAALYEAKNQGRNRVVLLEMTVASRESRATMH